MEKQTFRVKALASPDEPGSAAKVNEFFMLSLCIAQDTCEEPFFISRGYLSKEMVKLCGAREAHQYGKAVELLCPKREQKIEVIAALIQAGFKRFGLSKNRVYVEAHPEHAGPFVWNWGVDDDLFERVSNLNVLAFLTRMYAYDGVSGDLIISKAVNLFKL